MIALCILGLLIEFKKELDSVFILLITFLIVIIFPHRQGFRYLLPITPLIVGYFVNGMSFLKKKTSKTAFLILYFAICVLLFTTYCPGLIETRLDKTKTYITGPDTPIAQDTWNWIKQNTDENSVFLCEKPRVLALYANRNAIHGTRFEPDLMNQSVEKYDVSYLALSTWLPYPELVNYVDKYEYQFDLVYQNERWKIYKKKS